MSRLLAIDPGTRYTGHALFDMQSGLLLAAGAANGIKFALDPRRFVDSGVDELVLEVPQAYKLGKSKARPQDLITLALLAGEIRGFYRRRGAVLHEVLPHAWKGSVNKKVMVNRVKKRWMLPAEHSAAATLSATVGENMYDAVGVGIHWLRERGLRKDRKK